VTIEQLSLFCIFTLMNSARIQCTQIIKGEWCDHAGAYSSLINIHLHSSPDAHSTLTVCLICHPLCFRLCCQTPSLLCSATIMGERERCWLTERALGVSELFKTLAVSWFVNIHLWTDQQICKANEEIRQLAQCYTAKCIKDWFSFMLKDSQMRE